MLTLYTVQVKAFLCSYILAIELSVAECAFKESIHGVITYEAEEK